MFIETIILKEFIVRLVLFGATFYLVKNLCNKLPIKGIKKDSYSLRTIFAVLVLALFIGWFFQYIFSIISLSQDLSEADFSNYALYNPFSLALAPLVMLWVCYLVIVKKEQKSLETIFYQKQFKVDTIRWILYGFLCFAPIQFILLKISTDYVLSHNTPIYILPHPVFSFLIMALLIPVAEELMFREIAYNGLKNKLGILRAMIFTSLLFMILHNQWETMPFIFLLSMLYCYCYEKSKNLIVPILFHALQNFLTAASYTREMVNLFSSLENYWVLIITVFSITAFFVIRSRFGSSQFGKAIDIGS